MNQPISVWIITSYLWIYIKLPDRWIQIPLQRGVTGIKIESQTNPRPKNKKRFNLNTLLKNQDEHQIIFGKDKSGKSAILYKIALDILHDFNDLKTLPLYIPLC